MKAVIPAIILALFFASCTQFTRLSDQRIGGEKNFIFVRPFSGGLSPEEVAKLVSEKFFSRITTRKYFSGKEGKTYNFDFYMGQPCPADFDCYYITGEVSKYKYTVGCCGKDGVELTSNIKFWDDITKKPLFEISEWNNEVFEPQGVTQLQAIEWIAEDSANSLVKALLKELSKN